MNKQSKIECLLCHNNGPAVLISSKLRDDSLGKHKVYRCLTCGHVQIFPLPTDDEDELFYDNDMQTRNLMGQTDFKTSKNKAKADTHRRVNWINDVLTNITSQGGVILDVGCGYGILCNELSKMGYEAYGIDVSQVRIAIANEKCKGIFEQRKLDHKFINEHDEKFDIVTLFHVLEHLHEPEKLLKDCMSILKPGGILLVEVPNLNDELLNHCAEYRDFYWQRAHLSYFDQVHLDLLIRKAGYFKFCITGLQRYGLRNLLHWIDNGKPQKINPAFSEKNTLLNKYESIISECREDRLSCDTLLLQVFKTKSEYYFGE